MRKEILNEMDNQFLSIAELAQKANIDRTTLHKFLYDGTNIGLTALINISLVLFPNTHNEVMCKWCLELEKPENMRLAMEYTALNGNLSTLQILISKQENEGRKNKQWAEVYSLFLKFKKANGKENKKEIYDDLLIEVRNYKTSMYELNIFLRIIEVYLIFEDYKYNVMFEISKTLENQIKKIESEFIRESYLIRLYEMFAQGYLARNDTKKARHYANIVISSILCASLKPASVYIVGMSFLFEDRNLCVNNLESCDNLLSGSSTPTNYANFAKVFHGEKPDNMDTSNFAFYYAKAGQREKALSFVEKGIIEDGGKISPFKKYYRGLAEDCVKTLWESYGEFLSEGNLFFANLPRLALKELGESEIALDVYYKILVA